jgi:hypothetical protein
MQAWQGTKYFSSCAGCNQHRRHFQFPPTSGKRRSKVGEGDEAKRRRLPAPGMSLSPAESSGAHCMWHRPMGGQLKTALVPESMAPLIFAKHTDMRPHAGFWLRVGSSSCLSTAALLQDDSPGHTESPQTTTDPFDHCWRAQSRVSTHPSCSNVPTPPSPQRRTAGLSGGQTRRQAVAATDIGRP